jgi:CheY-like chemotaxis protein
MPEAQVSHARILVAEDEEAVRNLILRVMRAEGYSVDVCADGQEAFERLRDERFDLLLCDIRMPRLSGPELYARLSEQSPTESARVLFITGDTVREDTRRFIDTSQVPVLLKPFDMGTLVSKVAEVLGRQSGGGRERS